MTERGPLSDHAAVRLAMEGVPLNAIARGLKMKEGLVKAALLKAKSHGAIDDLPPLDWPDGSRVDSRRPATPPVDLAPILSASLLIKECVGLSPAASRLVACIYVLGFASLPTIWLAIGSARSRDFKLMQVYACKARSKLAALGISFGTVWGRGYQMSEADRAKLRTIMEPIRELGHAA